MTAIATTTKLCDYVLYAHGAGTQRCVAEALADDCYCSIHRAEANGLVPVPSPPPVRRGARRTTLDADELPWTARDRAIFAAHAERSATPGRRPPRR